MFNCLTGEGYYTLGTFGEYWDIEYDRNTIKVKRQTKEPISETLRDKLISEIRGIHKQGKVEVIE